MLDQIKSQLGANYKTGDDTVITNFINDYTIIALDATNRKSGDNKVDPYVKKAAVSAYLLRGNEGNKSSSEGSLNYSYEDIEEKLRANLIKNGLRLRK